MHHTALNKLQSPFSACTWFRNFFVWWCSNLGIWPKLISRYDTFAHWAVSRKFTSQWYIHSYTTEISELMHRIIVRKRESYLPVSLLLWRYDPKWFLLLGPVLPNKVTLVLCYLTLQGRHSGEQHVRTFLQPGGCSSPMAKTRWSPQGLPPLLSPFISWINFPTYTAFSTFPPIVRSTHFFHLDSN